jgi:glutathione S-transferase
MTTVYGAPLSPFVRKVLMALEIKSIEYGLENVAPGAIPDGYDALHPLRKIPSFKDDLITLCDSSVICDYLENRYPEAPIYPKDIVLRAKALWLEEYADSKIIAVLGRPVFYKRVVTKGMMGQDIDEAEIERHIEKEVPPVFDYLESQAPEEGYLVGDCLSIADISVVSHFINAGYAEVKVDANRWPLLSSYVERMLHEKPFQLRLERDAVLLARLLKKH